MNINDIMLQGDAGSGTTEASSKYYNVGKNNAATADAGYLGIRSKAVQTDFMMPQLQGLRESGSENYTGRQATEIAADRAHTAEMNRSCFSTKTTRQRCHINKRRKILVVHFAWIRMENKACTCFFTKCCITIHITWIAFQIL